MTTDTMTPHRRQYRVWMHDPDAAPDPDGTPALAPGQLVTVTYADQLRAEVQGRSEGLRSMGETPMHYATLWVWAAMVRTGKYAGKFQQFTTQDLGELEPVEQPGEDLDAPDPT